MQTRLDRHHPPAVTAPTHSGPAGGALAAVSIARPGGALANLQLLRAFAASLVLVHHVAVYAQALRGAARPFATLDTLMGVWGVAIFFALSGFLMARLVTRDAPLVFLAHRVSRIFPTYFGVVALSAGLFAALGLQFGGMSVLALSLAPGGARSSPLNVEWTLALELSFYVGLFLLASAGQARRLVPLAAGWLVLLAVAFPLLPPDSRSLMPPPLYLVPVTAACAPFAGGLLLPRLIASGWMRPATALLALPFLVLCVFVDTAAARWLGGVAAVLIVGAAVTAPPVRREGPVARGTIALGDWSYVLYLAHPPVLLLAGWACPPDWSGPAYAGVCLAGSLLAAALLGPLDVAFYRRVRGRIDAAGPVALRRGVTAFLVVFTGCALWGSTETARNDWAESRARDAVAALPAQAWTSRAAAVAAIAARGLALPPTLRTAVETVERISPTELLVGAYALDPDQPSRSMHLALFCGGRLAALDKPRRLRRDLAARPGFEAMSERRIGYRLRITADSCSRENAVAALVNETGLMTALAVPRAGW
ncbi:acyltransferase [Methylobacterium sp. WL30]|nr:acyltransferase [Methylobacterium sp. WL93]TXN49636.1 acyltransferase [Methylobacterium sp. WL119]TXN62912.1 acyltransferase [Methylobacterium sp. WL30]